MFLLKSDIVAIIVLAVLAGCDNCMTDVFAARIIPSLVPEGSKEKKYFKLSSQHTPDDSMSDIHHFCFL